MRYLKTFSVVCLILLSVLAVNAQTITVQGTVTDAESGTPLEFVTVIIEGTHIGTTTSSDGTFELDLRSANDALVFSFVGYMTQRHLPPADGAALNVQLVPSIEDIEGMVVIGTRRLPRLVTDSAVPIDVISPRDLQSTASTDIDDILRSQIPSYNVQRHEIDGSTTFVRPPILRGLSPDNTLLLVNGKRRHRSASLSLFGSALILGSQGPDMNMIPSIAVKQFEVLRDGASAQYGADAVAGVFNLQLRDASHGVSVRSQVGQYHQGDGRYISIAANAGFPLTEHGFVNVSLEYREIDPTNRSVDRADALALISKGFPVARTAQIWGNPDIDDAFTGFVNAEVDLTVDLFSITLRDRIALSDSIPLNDELATVLSESGQLAGFETLREVKFFSNDFDTRQFGVDVLLSWDKVYNEDRAVTASIAYNWTRPELLKFSEPTTINTFLGKPLTESTQVSILSPRRKVEMEHVNPHHRVIATGRQILGPYHGMVRLNYYSNWKACLLFSFSCTVGGQDALRTYAGSWIVDAEVGYQINENYAAAFGVNNIFAIDRPADPIERDGQGNSNVPSTPWDYNGAALYLRLSFETKRYCSSQTALKGYTGLGSGLDQVCPPYSDGYTEPIS